MQYIPGMVGIVIPCVLFVSTPRAFGQADAMRFERVENETGPSHNTVRVITQDRQGFLWIGTYCGGLNRLDPTTARVVRFDQEGPPRGICNSVVKAIHEDPSGRLWLATREGCVETGTRRFAGYTNIPPGDYVFRVKGSNSGGVWNERAPPSGSPSPRRGGRRAGFSCWPSSPWPGCSPWPIAIASAVGSTALKFTPEGGKVLVTLSERVKVWAYGEPVPDSIPDLGD